MKKVFTVSIFVIFMLTTTIGFLIYQINNFKNQNNEIHLKNIDLQNKNSELEGLLDKFTNKVRITFFSISGLKPYEGIVIFESNVFVKIHNFGINDVQGLTLTIVGFGDEVLAETLQIASLDVDEENEIYTHAYWVYGSYGTSIATLKLDDKILDQYYLPFSAVY